MPAFTRGLVGVGLSVLLLTQMALPALATTGLGGAQEELKKAGTKAFGGTAVNRTLEEVVADIISAFLALFGVLFLALMVYGGYLWMNARGNEQQVEKAKNLITSAIIGLVIALGGYIITRFVVEGILGATTGVETSSEAEPAAP